MTNRVLLFFGYILLFVAGCMAETTSPTPGEFPIVAYTIFDHDKDPDKANLKAIEECGFNLCMEYTNNKRYDMLLDQMKGTNLKLLLFSSVFKDNSKDANWRSQLVDFVNRYKNHPSVAGWEFADEPKWENIHQLPARYDLLKQTDPKHFILLNLVGCIVPKFTGPCKTMENYLDTIQKLFSPNVWSSDYYPITVYKGNVRVDYAGFFKNLQTFSDQAKKTGKPMWAYCESMEYEAKVNSRPAATEGHLSFEAFSALAYGAQGLVYWTYWQRPPVGTERYLSALVNLNGEKSKAWYAAQKVNLQIRSLTPVFLGANMVACRHTGTIKMDNIVPYISQFGPLETLQGESKGVLVSHLKNGDHNYLIIVNHDVEKKQKIKLKFKKEYSISEITANVGRPMTSKEMKKSVSKTLSPGGCLVVEWSAN